MAMEAAVLGKNFETGVRQLPSLEPFKDGEEGSMFYGAVSLFETGSVGKARRLLERAFPKLVPNPYLDYYRKKILG